MGIFLMMIPGGIIVWAVQRWVHSKPLFEMPLWRSSLACASFALGSASVLLWIFVGLWALVRGGFPFYDPVLLRMYAIGALLGLAGFVFSLPGKGKLRWPACGIAALMTFLWIAAATGE
jgi:hypothetical protein